MKFHHRRFGGSCLNNPKVEDNSDANNPIPPHLVIMVNGIVGSSHDWRYGAEQFLKRLPDKVIVHRSECNSSKLTFDGVDTMGERLAEEVLSIVRCWPGLQKISFVAHSLGGLVARYAIARLFDYSKTLEAGVTCRNCDCKEEAECTKNCTEQHYEARIAGLEPMNFITFATPHLGSRGHRQLPFLCGIPFLERRASQTAHLIVGRTGKHLFLMDNDDGKPPLLLRMIEDSDDLKFMSALCVFKRRVAYANANFDHMVGWRTSSIRRQHELPKSNLLVIDEKYPHIVHAEGGTVDDISNKVYVNVGGQKIDMEEEMIRGLTQVHWERVDVSFQKSKQRYTAHSTIQVKFLSYSFPAKLVDIILNYFITPALDEGHLLYKNKCRYYLKIATISAGCSVIFYLSVNLR
ncbi:serine esterase family protein [Medicago truncatula]|uniref:Serine esterase family protein n=1 Tax=Medicago truncatula TaxID=3880 RepID=G7JD34_MEDTR|nr:serine esterase family protein [Medicago truncatula]